MSRARTPAVRVNDTYVSHEKPCFSAYTRLSRVNRYKGEFLKNVLCIVKEWGIIEMRNFGEVSFPSVLIPWLSHKSLERLRQCRLTFRAPFGRFRVCPWAFSFWVFPFLFSPLSLSILYHIYTYVSSVFIKVFCKKFRFYQQFRAFRDCFSYARNRERRGAREKRIPGVSA